LRDPRRVNRPQSAAEGTEPALGLNRRRGAFALDRGDEAQEGRVAVDDDARRDRLKIAAHAALGFEARAEFRLRHVVDDAWQHPAGEIDAAARPEQQRRVAGDRSEHGAEHVERSLADSAAPVDRGLADLSGTAWRDIGTVELGDRAIEVL